MNLYIRYFDSEALVRNLDEACDFLVGLSDFDLTPQIKNDIQKYLENPANFPKRYRVKPRAYFILIKTTAESLEEFKANRKDKSQEDGDGSMREGDTRKLSPLEQEQAGWYKVGLTFKRVVQIAETNKFKYVDARIETLLYATSPQHAYDQVVAYVRSRNDIDARCQIPSAKGHHFSYEFIGAEKPLIEEENL